MSAWNDECKYYFDIDGNLKANEKLGMEWQEREGCYLLMTLLKFK